MKVNSLFLVVAIASWATLFFLDIKPFRDEVTIYFGQCIEQARDGNCPGSEFPAYVTKYKLDQPNRSVIYWGDDRPPSKYENCAIVDIGNWSCTVHSGKPDEKTVSLVNGVLAEDEPNSSFWPVFHSHLYPISKFRWWSLRLQQYQKRQWSRH